MEKNLTGVGEYTFNLLTHLFEIDSTNNYYLFFNSRKDVAQRIPKFNQPNVHYCQFKYPNKILNLSLKFFKYPKLDLLINKRFKTKIDKFFFPNISFFQTECPYLITAHDLSFELFPEFLSLKRKLWHKFINPKKCFQNAEKVISVSKNTKLDLDVRYQLSNVNCSTVYSGISKDFKPLGDGFGPESIPNTKRIKIFRQKHNLPQKFILALSTIEPRKNLDTLVDAFKEFNKVKPEYSLVITGPQGWGKQDKRDKQDERDKQIIWTGFVEAKDKCLLYNLASMFIYPSFYEGFGFPPLEAMASGCPVITTNNSSLSEVCEDAAILIDAHNSNDLLQVMRQMIKPEIKNYYQNKGIEQAQKFNWELTAQKLLQNINQSRIDKE
ncbi:glycosyltransferase family 4 protein [Candidatus Kuenenbacteria bacterium]|nr:glycosyltransferase family 4 protein [Candidatus Kuenenbacteria bacterium]